MSAFGDKNKTIITVGIAIISLALGAVLVGSHSDGGAVVEDNQTNVLTAAIAGDKNSQTPKSKTSVPQKTDGDARSEINITVSPIVSQLPTNTATPYQTPQTPTKTPPISKTPTPTPSKTFTPTPTSTSVQTPSTSPSPTLSLTPSPTPTQSGGNPAVIINEIGWMGTDAPQTGQYGEWLELYNPGNVQIDLSGWEILVSGDLLLNLSGTINPGQYFLIERVTPSSPDPITDIPADISVSFGSGGLNNSGDRLELIDSSGIVADMIDCSGGWFAGSNASPKKSMERKGYSLPGNNSGSWADNDGVTRNGTDKNGVPINGTPRSKNSQEI